MEYEIKESARARNMSVTVHPDGRITVIKPRFIPLFALRKWMEGKQEWVQEMQGKFQKSATRFEKKHGTPIPLPKIRRGSAMYKEAIATARRIATQKTAYFSRLGEFTYGTISIRNQSTRWGSCSARGNLSFNYRIAHLPDELADYLVVHELAHTKHHNHSPRFWAEVEKLIPDYEKRRNELQRHRF